MRRALGLYVWSAHAGRVMTPGCQVDITPILVGPQGLGKTRGVEAIAPVPEFFCEIGFHEKDDDRSRKMRGVLVCEIAELRGLNTTDSQSIKAFMSRRIEKWIPKYREKGTSFGRRAVMYGTSNEDELLADPTGERRWAPRRVEGSVNVNAIVRDRDQLWAEGLVLYQTRGVAWQEAERLAAPEHDAFRIPDSWEDRIARALDAPSTDLENPLTLRQRDGFKIEHIAVDVLHLDFARFGKREEQRIVKSLRALGCVSVTKRLDGRVQRVWVCKK